MLPLQPNQSNERQSDFPIVTLDEASSRQWDATMVPGAGFQYSTIALFARLTASNFGMRVQHILNDQTRRENFLAVNGFFQPHLVIFNNRHWPAGSSTDFTANRFHYLEGAVDTGSLFPARFRSPSNGQFIIGGLTDKNPEPLLEAARRLSSVQLRLFGWPSDLPERCADLVEAGKLVLLGLLQEHDLANFYHDLDCVVHTETFAGWANLAAESLASGVPLICTPHGTIAFAMDGVSAIVMAEATADAIVAAIERLRADLALQRTLSINGRRAIIPFSWERYASEILNLIDDDVGEAHYTYAPHLKLYGKWPLNIRLRGLDNVIQRVAGESVLDLGCAEGLISKLLLDAGAAFVHGIDHEPSRIQKAKEICQDSSRANFDVADLGNWSDVQRTLTRNTYGIVLYLGLHHHLPPATRMKTFFRATELAEHIFVVRMPERIYISDNIFKSLTGRGFSLQTEMTASEQSNPVRIFLRTSSP